MKCFNHLNDDAVGLCKHCRKGLCPECATDLDHGLACKNRHEEAVNSLDGLHRGAIQYLYSTPKKSNVVDAYMWPIFYIFMGAVFTFQNMSKGFDNGQFLLGAGFIVLGVVFAARIRHQQSKLK